MLFQSSQEILNVSTSIRLFLRGISAIRLSVIRTHFESSNISVIQCNSDNRIKEYLKISSDMLGDLKKSPYANRMLAILDQKHQSGLANTLEQLGMSSENIVVWDNNGIECYYPKETLKRVFSGSSEISINGDVITANGISYNKNELADKVTSNLKKEDTLN